MKGLTDRLKEHRQSILDIYNAQTNSNTANSSLVRAICMAILTDFNEKFPEIHLSDNKAYWHKLLEKYAHPWPGCPICNSEMIFKYSKANKFWGCSIFPKCTGARSTDSCATPTLNLGMKTYLTRRKQEEGLDNQQDERFRQLILDE